MHESFHALQVNEGSEPTVRTLAADSLAEGDVWVRVRYSSVNYKDALAVTGRGPIVKRYPMIPGVDLAGDVLQSASPAFAPGDEVLVTGYGIGEQHPGGYAELARVHSRWIVPLPTGMTQRTAMALGTAGLTAMLAATTLERQGWGDGAHPLLVTGAAGGVGSLAVAVMAALGQPVVASTGRQDAQGYLTRLGAREVIGRLAPPGPPLASQRWGGAIDVVGGDTLAAVLAATAHGGTVAACGLAGSSRLETTVFPFILRAVSLVGIDSAHSPHEQRLEAWDRLARRLALETVDAVTREIPLDGVVEASQALLAGRVQGRLVVNLCA